MKKRLIAAAVFFIVGVVFFILDQNNISLGEFSEGRSVSHYLMVICIIGLAYEFAVLLVGVLILRRRGAPGEVKMLSGLLRTVAIIGFLLTFLAGFGKLSAIGAVAAGFAGLLLGWSLQAPVSGIAAWVLICLKRPFRLGDRIFLPSLGLLGDVMEIGPMYCVLNQVGGSVGSEDAVGRAILIPNAMLFNQVVINYTVQQGEAYILDEVMARITFDSDWDAAEQILLEAAREVTGDIIHATGKEPYIRSDIYDYGVYLRLRYMTMATNRPMISHRINQIIFRKFQKHALVDFAIPFVYSYRKGMQSGIRAPSAPTEQPIAEMDIHFIVDGIDDQPLSGEELAKVGELAKKIDQIGLLQPVVVKKTGENRYSILAGHQRLRACKMLGWQSIPAIVRE
ncbi:MAG: ParB N-terminal domain-containing protein [Planctomycetota bacterium]